MFCESSFLFSSFLFSWTLRVYIEVKEEAAPRPKRDASKRKKKPAPPKEMESALVNVVSKFNNGLTKRQLEVEAYASIVAAFRAQGDLTWKKESILQDLRAVLKISDERHRMETRQAEEVLSQYNFPSNRYPLDFFQQTFVIYQYHFHFLTPKPEFRKQKQGTAYAEYYSDPESVISDEESNSEEDPLKQQPNNSKYLFFLFWIHYVDIYSPF
jgi:hypothetical protein